jgi:hypothetical protein
MNIISLKVSKNTLTILNKDPITTKNSKYLYAQFSFDMDWVNMAKTAIFYQKPNNVKQVILTNNGCLIPWEALELAGNLYIGIYGTQGTTRITTNVVSIMCQEGSFRKGTPPREPTKDVYAQLLEALADTKDIADSVRADADAGLFNGKDGASGVLPEGGTDGDVLVRAIGQPNGGIWEAPYSPPPAEGGRIIKTNNKISAIEFETKTANINRDANNKISSIVFTDGTSYTFTRLNGKIVSWEVD